MPCHTAMIDKPLTASPDDPVEKVLANMKKKKAEYVSIVDKDGVLQGLFSFQILMKNLLPVSVAMSNGVRIDVGLKAAPGIAKRMKKVLPLPVSDIMERKMNLVRPETPTWEGINLLVSQGAPLAVVEDENMKFLGLITSVSAVEDLQKMEEA